MALINSDCAPSRVTLVRGNHEDRGINAAYGFKDECLARFGQQAGEVVWSAANDMFDMLPVRPPNQPRHCAKQWPQHLAHVDDRPAHRDRSSVHSVYALTLCTHSMHSFDALTLCTHSMHSLCVPIRCTHSVHSLYALTLCTHSVHSSPPGSPAGSSRCTAGSGPRSLRQRDPRNPRRTPCL